MLFCFEGTGRTFPSCLAPSLVPLDACQLAQLVHSLVRLINHRPIEWTNRPNALVSGSDTYIPPLPLRLRDGTSIPGRARIRFGIGVTAALEKACRPFTYPCIVSLPKNARASCVTICFPLWRACQFIDLCFHAPSKIRGCFDILINVSMWPSGGPGWSDSLLINIYHKAPFIVQLRMRKFITPHILRLV